MKQIVYITGVVLGIMVVVWVGVTHYRSIAPMEDVTKQPVDEWNLIPASHNCCWQWHDFHTPIAGSASSLPAIFQCNDWEKRMFFLFDEWQSDSIALFSDKHWVSTDLDQSSSRLLLCRLLATDPLLQQKFLQELFGEEELISEEMAGTRVYYLPLSKDRFVSCAFFRNVWIATDDLSLMKQVVSQDSIIPRSPLRKEETSVPQSLLTFYYLPNGQSALLPRSDSLYCRFSLDEDTLAVDLLDMTRSNKTFSSLALGEEKTGQDAWFLGEIDSAFAWTRYGWPWADSLQREETDEAIRDRGAMETADYLDRCSQKELSSIDFIADGEKHTVWQIEMQDSTLAFDCFRKEMKQRKALRYLHYRWIDRRTYYIYELTYSGYLPSLYPLSKEEPQGKETGDFVTFAANKMFVSESLQSIEAYLRAIYEADETVDARALSFHAPVGQKTPLGRIDCRLVETDWLKAHPALSTYLSLFSSLQATGIDWSFGKENEEEGVLRLRFVPN